MTVSVTCHFQECFPITTVCFSDGLVLKGGKLQSGDFIVKLLNYWPIRGWGFILMNAAARNKAMTHLFTSIDVVYSKCLCFSVCHACFPSGLEHWSSEAARIWAGHKGDYKATIIPPPLSLSFSSFLKNTLWTISIMFCNISLFDTVFSLQATASDVRWDIVIWKCSLPLITISIGPVLVGMSRCYVHGKQGTQHSGDGLRCHRGGKSISSCLIQVNIVVLNQIQIRFSKHKVKETF